MRFINKLTTVNKVTVYFFLLFLCLPISSFLVGMAEAQTAEWNGWEIRIISVGKIKVLKTQYVEGAKFTRDFMYRGGKLITEDVKAENGTFLIIHIDAKQPDKERPTTKDTKSLICNSELTFVIDDKGRRYSTKGSLREEGEYFVGLLSIDKDLLSPILSIRRSGSGKFNLYFDVSDDAKGFKLQLTEGFPLIELPIPIDLDETKVFLEAVNAGNTEKINTLLKKNSNLVNATYLNTTPLHMAALKGHKKVVEVLLAKGADIKAKDDDGLTPLHNAVAKSDKTLLELLLSNGADPNDEDTFRNTPLHYAVQLGNKIAVEVLVANGANINAKGENNATPLHLAVKKGQKEIADFLRKHGATE